MKCKLFAAFLLCGILTFASPVNAFAEEVVAITDNGMATDSFMGVEANYIKGTGNSNTGTYCCAGYVKKFYLEIYGVTVYNINTIKGKPTVVMEGHEVSLVEVDEPKPGDMMQSLTYSHVAIVKEVTDEGTAILIEQNYKWSQNGQTVAMVEREISFDEAHFYRLIIDGEEQYITDDDILMNSFETAITMPSITDEDIDLFLEYLEEDETAVQTD